MPYSNSFRLLLFNKKSQCKGIAKVQNIEEIKKFVAFYENVCELFNKMKLFSYKFDKMKILILKKY